MKSVPKEGYRCTLKDCTEPSDPHGLNCPHGKYPEDCMYCAEGGIGNVPTGQPVSNGTSSAALEAVGDGNGPAGRLSPEESAGGAPGSSPTHPGAVITTWYRDEEFNHISNGWDPNKTIPDAVTDVQRKSFKGAKWKSKQAELRDGVVHESSV